jgi:hypothetical protein
VRTGELERIGEDGEDDPDGEIFLRDMWEEGEDDGVACETFSYDNPEEDLNPRHCCYR